MNEIRNGYQPTGDGKSVPSNPPSGGSAQQSEEKPNIGVEPYYIAAWGRIRELADAISRHWSNEKRDEKFVGKLAEEIKLQCSMIEALRDTQPTKENDRHDENIMRPMSGPSFHGEDWYRCPKCQKAFEYWDTVHGRGFKHVRDKLYQHICGQVLDMT